MIRNMMIALIFTLLVAGSAAGQTLTLVVFTHNVDSVLVDDLIATLEEDLNELVAKDHSLSLHIVAESLAISDSMLKRHDLLLEERNADMGISFAGRDEDETYDFVLLLKPSRLDSIALWTPVRPFVKELCFIKAQWSWIRSFLRLSVVEKLGYTIDQVDIDLEGEVKTTIAKLFNIAFNGHQLLLNGEEVRFDPGLYELYEKGVAAAQDTSLLEGYMRYNYALFCAITDSSDLAIRQLDIADSLFASYQDSIYSGLTNVAFYHLYSKMDMDSLALASLDRARSFAPELSLLRSLYSVAAESNTAAIDSIVDNPFDAAEALYERANALSNEGQLDEALSLYQQYLSVAGELANEVAIARAHFGLGTVQYAMENADAAMPHFLSAEEYFEMLGDTCRLAKVDINLGAIYHEKEDFATAQLRYESALSQAKRCKDQENVMRAHSNLGDLFSEQEQWAKAHKHYNQALDIATFYNDEKTVALLNYAKGLAHLKEGHLKLGYDEIKIAFELGRDTLNINPEKEERFLRRLEELIRNQEMLAQ
jgi:tetratricopeptide (TPR) repeat protein